jgi:hypothetical protein
MTAIDFPNSNLDKNISSDEIFILQTDNVSQSDIQMMMNGNKSTQDLDLGF